MKTPRFALAVVLAAATALAAAPAVASAVSGALGISAAQEHNLKQSIPGNKLAIDDIVDAANAIVTVTPGTVKASSPVVVDASKNAQSFGIIAAGNYRVTNGSTFTAADPNPSRATLRAAGFFLVDTTANAVDLDISDDADFEAADLGTEWLFLISAGGTNALTVTNGASGVAVTTLNALGTTCEDVGDSIRCTAFALEKALCVTTCAD